MEMKVRGKRSTLTIVAIIAVVLIGIGAVGVWLYVGNQSKPVAKVPGSVASRLTFPVYLPSRLPGEFDVVGTSFSLDRGVLIFKAQDSSGAVIAFTEQAKPDNFDFASFYKEQFTDLQTLDNVPFASVTGTNQQQYMVLSVVTDKTWIIVSSRAPLTKDNLQAIAQSMQLQAR